MPQTNDPNATNSSLWSRLFRRDGRGAKALDGGTPTVAGDPVHQALQGLVSSLIQDRQSERRSRLIKASIYFLIFGAPTLLYIGIIGYMNGARWIPTQEAVGVVRVEGDIAPGQNASADQVIPALKAAFESEKIKAVVLAIDSNGGAPVEAERINNAMATMRAKHPKPVVAVIGNSGMSAGYMIAMHTDRIYAGKYSLVGSIGAVMASWDFHKALEKVDVAQRVYASGPLKAMMNPYLPMTAQANDKAQDLVNRMGSQFHAEMSSLRKGLKPNIQYGTGEVWGGSEALAIGIVDELGTIDDLIERRWKLPAHDFGPGGDGYKGIHAAAAAGEFLRSLMIGQGPSAQGQVTLR